MLMEDLVSFTSACRRPLFCGLLAQAHASFLSDWICATSWSAADHAREVLLRNLVEKNVYVHITLPKRCGRVVLQWGMEGPMRGAADGGLVMDGVGQT